MEHARRAAQRKTQQEHRNRIYAKETAEEREQRLQKRRNRNHQFLANETPEGREARLQLKREKYQQKVANETQEERTTRLQKEKEAQRRRRAGLKEAATVKPPPKPTTRTAAMGSRTPNQPTTPYRGAGEEPTPVNSNVANRYHPDQQRTQRGMEGFLGQLVQNAATRVTPVQRRFELPPVPNGVDPAEWMRFVNESRRLDIREQELQGGYECLAVAREISSVNREIATVTRGLASVFTPQQQEGRHALLDAAQQPTIPEPNRLPIAPHPAESHPVAQPSGQVLFPDSPAVRPDPHGPPNLQNGMDSHRAGATIPEKVTKENAATADDFPMDKWHASSPDEFGKLFWGMLNLVSNLSPVEGQSLAYRFLSWAVMEVEDLLDQFCAASGESPAVPTLFEALTKNRSDIDESNIEAHLNIASFKQYVKKVYIPYFNLDQVVYFRDIDKQTREVVLTVAKITKVIEMGLNYKLALYHDNGEHWKDVDNVSFERLQVWPANPKGVLPWKTQGAVAEPVPAQGKGDMAWDPEL